MSPGLKRWAVPAAVLLALFALAGAIVAVSGVVPIRASSGHWAVTEALLQFGKRRSVATHTLGMQLPNLKDPALVLRGAGAYDLGCRPCHGSPELRAPKIAAAMTPSPPYLDSIVADYEPRELFYIVKHGIKFTGMPAWPAQQRDDEVQAMVAFLLELPKLQADSYRQLVNGDEPSHASPPPLPDLPSSAAAVLSSCARCHGRDGSGRGLGAFPRLAGQKPEYLLRALDAYADERRHSGVMAPIAVALDADERRALAEHFARLSSAAVQSALQSAVPETLARVRRGEEIASKGIPSQGVPSCRDCHGPSDNPTNPVYPHLAGQYAEYLQLQLELFKAGNRGGSTYAHLMKHVASRLNSEQMRDVAAYYSTLQPSPLSPSMKGNAQ